MLEFREGFFNQEIRDGFYLDVTIKTLWAAEMELLQKIAEVCDRYELRWFAAYGTLLGAIRHEGYVPWDDDMDIWLIRNDYNKLLEVLPQELPKGYRVRGPQTEEGYDQFHTCVNNGSGISIAKDWLEENHNCPFTVGIDIFPLDYLPRNKKNQELQKNLFTLVGRVAQLSKNIARGDYDDANAVMTKDDAIAQINEGLKYLKKNFKFKLDKQWIADEKWDKIASEVWKWGNYVAMMYTEQESDYLVEYLDWVKWDTKKFPKEWFAETYAAQFEDFMLPIPWKYDEVLLTVYSNYQIRVRKGASHEYPFYARQLRQLKQYVHNMEKGIQESSIEEVEDISEPIPDELKQIVDLARRNNKKIILSANNPSVFVKDGENALNRLEELQDFFGKHQDKLVLWWRPHPLMPKILDGISIELGDKYRKILQHYKNTGIGICDESDNTDWAVDSCDIYYGEMNAVLQPFQNAEKPIVLLGEHTEDIHFVNSQMLLETRTFLNFTDYVEDGELTYFANTNYNALVICEKNSGNVIDMVEFKEAPITAKNLHLRCVKKNKKICFLPVGTGKARIYNTETKVQKVVDLNLPETEETTSWDSFVNSENIFLLPSRMEHGLWIWNPDTDQIIIQDWWKPGESDSELKHGRIDDSKFFTLVFKSNILLVTDVKEQTVKAYRLPDEDVCTIQGNGVDFWYTTWSKPGVVRWNINDGSFKKIALPGEVYYGKPFTSFYYASFMVGKNLYLTSRTGESLFVLNTENNDFQCLHTIVFDDWDFQPYEKVPFFKSDKNKLIYNMKNTHKFRTVDLDNNKVTEYREYINVNKMVERYRNNVLMKRGVLFFEENGVFDREKLLLGVE